MREPEVPRAEAARIAVLHALQILDTSAEERFDRITRIAAAVFDVPIALVTLIDEDRQWFKSRLGIDVDETPREISFCAHTINETEPLVVSDTALDVRFTGNPLVEAGPKVRFYAGQAVRTADGFAVGTLCIADTVPRSFDTAESDLLADLAALVEQELVATNLTWTVEELLAVTDGQEDGMAVLQPLRSDEGVICDFRLSYANRAAAELLGDDPRSLIGRRFTEFPGPNNARLVATWIEAMHAGQPVVTRFAMGVDGPHAEPTHEVRAVPLSHAITVSIHDLTITRDLEQQVLHSASHDALTDLPGRQVVVDRTRTALAETDPKSGPLCVIHLDINGFKEVNDTLGHEVGDGLIRLLADRVVAAAPADAIVGRPGGDEFLVVARHTGDLVRSLLAAVSRPVHLIGNELRVTASAGMATTSTRDVDADALLRNAEIAMYEAKELGADRYTVFGEELREGVLDRVERKSILRTGLRRHEFVPWYQPEISMETGEIVGLEALARWQRGGGRPVETAGPFVELAEQTGLIGELGQDILEQVCSQIVHWQQTLDAPVPRVWVNLSASQLVNPGAAEELLATLERWDIDTTAVGVEITETALLSDAAIGIAALDELSRSGVKIAVDDFGTGYASLTYVKSHQIDVLKVDGTFVAGLPGDPEDVAIVSATVALGSNLGMRIVAEGIETTAQFEAARALGCTEAQGYLFTPALPGDKVEVLIESQPWRHA